MPRALRSLLVEDLGRDVDLIFSIAAHPSHTLSSERLTFTLDGEPIVAREISDHFGNRIHTVTAGPGQLHIEYEAEATRQTQRPATDEAELLLMRRPSRYAESDILFRTARDLFAGLAGHELLNAVRDYVHSTVEYAPASTTPTDSAVTTMASKRGVCRDFSHLAIALLRAMDVPARYVSCYAPGLKPMDFHAVVEAYVEGDWYVIDATGLTDRTQLVRIATGRDAADCAFLTFHGGSVKLARMKIDAWVQEGADRIDPSPEHDDPQALVRIS